LKESGIGMGIKAVIDTNVLVSSFISKNTNSPTVRIIKAIIEGIFTPVYSDDILSEYEKVLGRGRFKLDPAAISILIQRIKEIGEAVSPIVSEEDFPDPDDKVFFCTALAGDAQLVTGNIKHYPTAELVVTPAQFCEIAGI
jgi:putative PIN family toxin of toxin-antitoxin system